MVWSKSSDWLPLSNAKAQVEFWKKDLEFAKKYLNFVLSLEKKFKNDKFWKKALDIAKKDVELSERELQKALWKLEESKQLENS